MSISFREYVLTGVKNGICPVCGRKSRRVKKFCQTQNPFNKNKDGVMKSMTEIIAECEIERELWMSDPCFHVKCEKRHKEIML